MRKLDPLLVSKIVELRRTGHSLPEIHRLVKCGYGTVMRYIKGVEVAPEFQALLRQKQGGSKVRAQARWKEAENKVTPLIGVLKSRDKVLILAALYWGEGTKNELNIINSDWQLLSVFLSCLEELGVSRQNLSYSLRTFDDISLKSARQFWSEKLLVPIELIQSGEVIRGKKQGKLPFGMCRIRMRKGAESFKQIMTMIQLIASQIGSPRSSMDRTAAS